jgi:hypothetical protein
MHRERSGAPGTFLGNRRWEEETAPLRVAENSAGRLHPEKSRAVQAAAATARAKGWDLDTVRALSAHEALFREGSIVS